MTLTVRGSELARAELEAFATRRIGFALGRLVDQVTRIRVSLSDENGPRGGVDKRCRIEVRGPGRLTVMIEDAADDERAAIARAAERARRSLVRALERRRARR